MGIAQALTSLKVELAALRFTPIITATMIDSGGQPRWNIVPGETIRIRWRFDHGLLERGPDIVNVRFRIEGQLVHQIDGISATDPFGGGTGDKTAMIVVGDPNIASVVYKFGVKRLELEVHGDEGGRPVAYSDTRWFEVVPEPADATWWQWQVAPFEEVDWKEAYSIFGDFINNFRFAKVQTLTVELSEVRSENNPQINPCDYQPVKVETRNLIAAGGGRVSILFDFRQDWTWFTPGIFAITGPQRKIFAYAASFYFTDEYGNGYDGFCSAKITRLVRVSAVKGAAAGTAMSAAVTAAYLAAAAAAAAAGIITAVLAPGLIAAAGVSYGIAAAAGAVALDPPVPDPNYREPLTIIPLPLTQWPKGLSTPAQLKDLRSLLETAARVLALEGARTLTRARLMGARVFGDETAVELHRQGYLKIEREMVEAAAKLERILPEVEKQIEASGFFDPKKLSVWLDALAQGGFPQAMQEIMTKTELDGAQINGLAALMQRPFIELVKVTGLLIMPLVVNLRQFVQEVEKEKEAILAGEPCVPMPRRPETASEEEPYPDPEARLRWQPRRR